MTDNASAKKAVNRDAQLTEAGRYHIPTMNKQIFSLGEPAQVIGRSHTTLSGKMSRAERKIIVIQTPKMAGSRHVN